MLKNYFKVAWRNIIRHKGYSFINIFGLAAGIACCILIMVWVQNELSFDRFHGKSDRIYRLYNELTLNGQTRTAPVTSAPMAPALRQSFPEVESAVRLSSYGDTVVKYGEREFREDQVYLADDSIFDVFSFPMLQGDPKTALSAAYSTVITEKTARRYFGAENPLGKVLKFGDGYEYAVTGVIKDIPGNSHLDIDILCSFATWISQNKQEAEMWGRISFSTYILLAPGTNVKQFTAKMDRLTDEKIGNDLKKVGGSLRFYLQPLTRIHLHSNFEMDFSNAGSIQTVYLFSAVALFILLIACINFINLATARYANRAMEVGLKKTLGASRGSLVRQFLGETFFVTFLAVLSACLMATLALPLLGSISGQEFSAVIFLQPLYLMSFALFVLLVGIVAGSYPAFFLSSFDPIQTLKGKLKGGAAGSLFRRILVVSQFAISIALVIGTLIISEQMRFVRGKDLGFDKAQVLVLSLPQSKSISRATVREEMASTPGVVHAGLSDEVPGMGFKMSSFIPEGRTEKEGLLMQRMESDDQFLSALGIRIVRGRNFSQQMKTDTAEAVLINETAAARLGWEDPLGKRFSRKSRGPDGQERTRSWKIVGVIKDFHTLSLHEKIEPLLIANNPENLASLSLRLTTGDIQATISRLKKKWQQLYPDQIFDSFFLDESFGRMYRAEEQFNKIFSTFSVLAILISCLGLFGLAAYMTEKRTKEVGIRKVLGASTWRIVLLLSNEFGKWVLIANVIAWPLAYYFMNRWLQTFAYHTAIGIGVFFFSGLAAMAIALLTVSYQSIHTARRNPVDSLRYE
jgi:putative ABC transport system permease protein